MLYSVIEIEEDDLQECEEPFTTYCIVEGEQSSALFVGDLARARIIEFHLVEKGLDPEHIADFISEEFDDETK
ncbi:hypothetical protein [Nostoc sp. 'Peltigera membranacea cyanobiont' 232]|uniref:hypothetical protein n=1 Tax=Nostoc sp. 'Peltigera membranacea cyanobiont' 232 TaxID=2014531 RepID=UPI000B9526C4|nr:hypothetical protein [Nostoc sp. 'Peltigera membranacea cyanobiont' 232]OYE01987.1 hypothetical protein CDG79_26355 [Nostoc sp. 'Peltigera membranacea cyanobiont' 232]